MSNNTIKSLEDKIKLQQKKIKELESEITESKKFEEKLKEEKQYVDILFNTAQVVVLVLDFKGRIVSFNSYMEKLCGFTLDEVKEKDWFDTFLPKGDHTRIRELFSKAVNDIQTMGNINSIVSKNGELIEIEWYDKTLTDSNKNVTGLLAIGVDITERKKAELELHQLANIAASSTDMMAILNNDYIYIASNDSYLNAFNLSSKNLIGHTVSEVFGTDFFNKVIKPHADLCLNGKHVNFQSWFDFPSTERKFMDINYYPYLDIESNIQGFVVNGRDITRSKQSDDAFVKQKESVEQKNVALKEILEQIELEKQKIKDDIAANVEEVLLPALNKLKMKGAANKHVQVIRNNLKEMTSSFGKKISEKHLKLTPREIEICNLIKEGLSTKDIANMQNLSVQTIEKHRTHIRRKLGLINKDFNLTTYLQSI